MKLRMLLCGLIFAGASALITSQVLSGGQEPKGDKDADMWAALAKYTEPGKHHEYLKPLAGKWNLNVKMRMAPDAPWEESKSESEITWIMGGRFLRQNVTGDFEGRPFEGLGLIGYDNFAEHYTSMWVDNVGTTMTVGTGTCDDSGKVFTSTGEYANPMTGNKHDRFKGVTRIVNNDKFIDEWWATGPDGKLYRTMEITYTRK